MGFVNAFATAPNKLPITEKQQNKLIKNKEKKHINKKEKLLTQEKVRRPLWINWHTKNSVLTIPSKYTDIGENAFYKRTNLTSIDLRNVKTIVEYAFKKCTGLTSIDLKNVESIGDFAFRDCTRLTSIDLKNVKSIGRSTFEGCSALTPITIPDSVQSIGKYAFKDCYACTFIVQNDRVHKLLTGSGVSKYRIAIEGQEKP